MQHKPSVVSVISDGDRDPNRSRVPLSVSVDLDSEKDPWLHITVGPDRQPSTNHPSHIHPTSFLCCSSDDMDGPVEDIGSRSCVTRFVKTLLSIMEHGVKPHSKHLTEYFAFLYEFAKMGEEEVGLNFSTESELLF